MTHQHVVMFSSGAGSAMAAKRVAERYGPEAVTLLFADVNGEHADNYRFLDEAAEWVGAELVRLDNDGRTIWDVFRDRKFLGNTRVDTCSETLKRIPMRRWLTDNCDPAATTVHIGFDWQEGNRIERAAGYWEPWQVDYPLLWEPMLDKAQVIEALDAAGIEPPWLTRVGFPHANCRGGCIKAGHEQFAMLRRVDPEAFDWWEQGEASVRLHLDRDVAILRDRRGGDTTPMPLSAVREAIDSQPEMFAGWGWGGCGCIIPASDTDEEA